MERVQGVIKLVSGEDVFGDVEINIRQTSSRGRRGWRGSFSVPGDEFVTTGNYCLELEDGREANISISNVQARSSVRFGNRTAVHFVVLGSLAQPV